MSNDLISRSAFLNILHAKANMAACTDAQIVYDHVANMVEKMPTVDAEPVRHGRYIQLDEDTWQCSACGVLWTFLDGGPEDNEVGYCPNCGAKMDVKVAYEDE